MVVPIAGAAGGPSLLNEVNNIAICHVWPRGSCFAVVRSKGVPYCTRSAGYLWLPSGWTPISYPSGWMPSSTPCRHEALFGRLKAGQLETGTTFLLMTGRTQHASACPQPWSQTPGWFQLRPMTDHPPHDENSNGSVSERPTAQGGVTGRGCHPLGQSRSPRGRAKWLAGLFCSRYLHIPIDPHLRGSLAPSNTKFIILS